MRIFEPTDLQHLAKGDREAFRRLFDTFYIPLVQRAAFFLNDIDAAEDVVQATFTIVWTQRQKLGQVQNIEGYLFRWVRNDCLNHIKHQNISSKNSVNYVRGGGEDADPEPYIAAIATLLEKLPRKRRQVLELSIFDSKSYPEIASELGISINTVKDHIKKAYAFLREKSDSIPYPP